MGEFMKQTFHSIMRCRQRGIAETNIELILSIGTANRKPGGVIEYFISRKDKQRIAEVLKQCLQSLDKLVGKAIIVDDEGSTVITAYHKTR
jgi:hypothetical protein